MKAEEPFDRGEASSPLQDRPFDQALREPQDNAQDERSLVTFCATHPEVETALRCGRCDKPICPRCIVQTPVGGRCKECANMKRLPIFEVSAQNYAKAVVLAFLASLVLGFIWASLPFRGYFSFIVSAGVGYALGELVSYAASRKSSVGLKIIAGASVVLCYLSSVTTPILATLVSLNVFKTAAFLNLFISGVVGLLSNPFAWLIVGIGVFVAVTRLR